MLPRLLRAVLALALPLPACASPAPPPPGSPDMAPQTAAAAPYSPASAAADAPADVPAHKARPLDLVSSCPHDVKLYYGEQPGDGKGQSATIATGATLAVPRGPDGTVVVWVVDDKGFGLASVHVTRRMRHVKLDAACGRIDAD